MRASPISYHVNLTDSFSSDVCLFLLKTMIDTVVYSKQLVLLTIHYKLLFRELLKNISTLRRKTLHQKLTRSRIVRRNVCQKQCLVKVIKLGSYNQKTKECNFISY